ncbi:MAG: hypothetical protein ACYC61_03710, partial [Isosphaeraceae bacterium]
MIPTRVKSKLPRGLSYPIGAEALSEALAGSPHVEAISLWFSDHPGWRGSESRRVLAAREPYRIVEVRFRPAGAPGFIGSRDMIKMGWFDEAWEIHVCPVLSEFRHLAHRLLCEQGRPALGEVAEGHGTAGRGP